MSHSPDDISDADIPVLIQHPPPPVPEPQKDSRRVPLTIISGFLGAGKSTLLKRILSENHGYRIAVIMNEFADTADIESRTINVSSDADPTAEMTEEFLELANGCLCCSIKDSGVAAIENLMRRRGAFDYILLETTGLADPGPIASMFWQNEDFSRGLGTEITLDGVVCVVDAVFGQQQMEEDHASNGIGESLRQIAAADVILLNKADLAAPESLDATERLLRGINPAASVHRTVRGAVDLRHIVGIAAYASGPLLQKDRYTAGRLHEHEDGDDHHNEHGHDHDHDHDHAHATHYEMRGITSLQVTCPVLTPAQHSRLDEWIRTVLWENRLPWPASTGAPEAASTASAPLEVLRCKGMFTSDAGQCYVLQGVRSMYEIAALEEGAGAGADDVSGAEVGKLVFIGKGLDNAVRASLQEVFA